MAVDGKNIRIGTLVFCLLLCFSALCSSSRAFAANTQQLQSVDLRRDLCDPTQVEINRPLAGIEFVSESKLLAYTVCQTSGQPTLSIRGEFKPSDSKHLRAAIVDLATGNVEEHFDWPTQGDTSSVSVTNKGNLLVERNNFLETYNLQGQRIARLELKRVSFHDPLMMIPAHAVGTIAVTEPAITDSGMLIMGTLVLDEDTLQPLFRWKTKNEGGDRVIAASPAMAAAWQDVRGEKRVVIREPGDTEWKTVWSGPSSFMIGPQFLDSSRFVIATDKEIMVFNGKGDVEARTSLKAEQYAVAKDGKHMVTAYAEPSPSAAFAPSIRIDVFGASFQRTATLANFASDAPDFRVALSPDGDKLAILGHLHVKVLAITE
jgi:hypothetical protein